MLQVIELLAFSACYEPEEKKIKGTKSFALGSQKKLSKNVRKQAIT